jgi:hypothetical protein
MSEKKMAVSPVLAEAVKEFARLLKIVEEFAQRKIADIPELKDATSDDNSMVFIMPKEGTPEREAAEMMGTFADALYESHAVVYLNNAWRARKITEVLHHRDNCADCKARELMAKEPATKWKN